MTWLWLLLLPASLVLTFVLIEVWDNWDRKQQGLMTNKDWKDLAKRHAQARLYPHD